MNENIVFIGLGSNMGDREQALSSAIASMGPDITVTAVSNIYETEPWGFTDQPAFLNQVVQVSTRLTPIGLLEKLKAIEKEMGRKPNFRYGPRIIDLDILFYNDIIIETESLSVPHKEICNRAFVLIPLLDIAPAFVHPASNKSMQELASIIDHKDVALFKESCWKEGKHA